MRIAICALPLIISHKSTHDEFVDKLLARRVFTIVFAYAVVSASTPIKAMSLGLKSCVGRDYDRA